MSRTFRSYCVLPACPVSPIRGGFYIRHHLGFWLLHVPIGIDLPDCILNFPTGNGMGSGEWGLQLYKRLACRRVQLLFALSLSLLLLAVEHAVVDCQLLRPRR